MKAIKILSMMLCLVASMTFAACGDDNPKEPPMDDEEETYPDESGASIIGEWERIEDAWTYNYIFYADGKYVYECYDENTDWDEIEEGTYEYSGDIIEFYRNEPEQYGTDFYSLVVLELTKTKLKLKEMGATYVYYRVGSYPGSDDSDDNEEDENGDSDGKFDPNFYTGKVQGYKYIDLGLPSGLKWATCNIGAEYPTECGDYFAWGETSTKSDYDWDTYKWCRNGDKNSLTKYCLSSMRGEVDNKSELEPEDDAATVQWGSRWRMPTEAECTELIKECVYEYITINGIEGGCFTGPNGNKIFFPITGYAKGTEIEASHNGHYYTSTLSKSGSRSAVHLGIVSPAGSIKFSPHMGTNTRYNGLVIRPVTN